MERQKGRHAHIMLHPLRQSIETNSWTYSVPASIFTSAWRVRAGLTIWASALTIPENLNSAFEQRVSMVRAKLVFSTHFGHERRSREVETLKRGVFVPCWWYSSEHICLPKPGVVIRRPVLGQWLPSSPHGHTVSPSPPWPGPSKQGKWHRTLTDLPLAAQNPSLSEP